jgi:hypothetical protein
MQRKWNKEADALLREVWDALCSVDYSEREKRCLAGFDVSYEAARNRAKRLGLVMHARKRVSCNRNEFADLLSTLERRPS